MRYSYDACGTPVANAGLGQFTLAQPAKKKGKPVIDVLHAQPTTPKSWGRMTQSYWRGIGGACQISSP